MVKRWCPAVILAAAFLASAASAVRVEDWVELPLAILAPAVPLFSEGDGGTTIWPSTVAEPWYQTTTASPLERRRGWIDFGVRDAAGVSTAVSHLMIPRRTEIEFVLACDTDARLSLDGAVVLDVAAGDKEGRHRLTLDRGKTQLLVEVAVKPGERARFRLDAEATGTELGITTDSRRLLSRFDDTRLIPSIADLALSPDGAYLLILHGERDKEGVSRRRLELLSLETGRRATITDDHVSQPAWTSKTRFTYRDRGDLVMRDLLTGNARRLLDDVEGLGQCDMGSPIYYLADPGGDDPPDPHRLTELRERLTDWSDTAVLSVRHGLTDLARTTPLTATGDFHVTSFAVRRGAENDRLAVVRKVPRTTRPFFASEIWLLDGDGSHASLLTTVTTGFEIWPMNLAWSPDGARLAWTCSSNDVGDGQPERNWARTDVWVADLVEGGIRNLTAGLDAAPQDREGDALTWLDERTLALPVDVGHEGRLLILDVLDGSTQFHGEGGTVDHCSVAAEGRRAVWVRSTFDEPFRVEMLDLETGEARTVPEHDAPPLELPVVEPFEVVGPGGGMIDGWFYRPIDAGEGPAPLVVYYYGGAISTMGGFNTTHQWLAANGYAVYVINPRGAHTYGQDFADEHVNDWGVRAPADVLAGVEALLSSHPEFDRDHVGCYGGSYGGFMTLSLLTQSDVFAAAVSMYGISDLASYWGEGIWGYTYGDMAMADSYPWSRPDLYADRSPLYHADAVTTPLLLLHGAADVNVPPGESEQMFTALKVLGREVELVRFAGEDHGISGSWRNRTAHRTMMLEWFDRWLKDQPEAWQARWSDGE